MRSRRLWWGRNGAFVRGMMAGVALCLAVTWVVQLVLEHRK
ncbi:hypothetical protein [Phenylobacterium sp.]